MGWNQGAIFGQPGQQYTGAYNPQMGQQMGQPVQQPYMYQPQQAPQPILWVQGEAGAKSYPLAPNGTVVLWDSENDTIFIKSCDASGMPTLRVFDYVERPQGTRQAHAAPVPQPPADYISREEFNALKQDVEKMKGGHHDGEQAV